MQKKHIILIGIFCSCFFFYIATAVYPGGSMFDKNAPGFDWTKNFISNLFAEKAINGALNPSRIWANAAMLVFSGSLTYFFIQVSGKLPHPSSQKIVRYLGSAGMFFNFLIVSKYHDLMVVLSSICFLISLFYITEYIFKSKQHFLKILCVICLLIFYATLFIYGAGPHEILPHMQKLTIFSVISLVLSIHYFYKT